MTRMTLSAATATVTRQLTMDVPVRLTADVATSRRVRGLIVPWGTPGRTSLGTVRVRRGALTLPDQPARMRLLYGHDREHPIGAAVSLRETDEGLEAEFAIAATALGDQYLAELDPAAPVRDGLSIEVDDPQISDGWLVSGLVAAAAAVPLPAYPGARASLAAEDTPPTPTLTAAVDGATAASASHPAPAAPALPPAAGAGVDAPGGPLTASEPHARPLGAPAQSAARTRPVDAVRMVAERLTAARLDGSAPRLVAALSDVTPTGNGAGNSDAALMRQALGELWSGMEYVPVYRPLVVSGLLTGAKVSGWRWSVAPEVAPYEGDKTAITSNPAKLEYVEASPARLAGGHDLDRIYRDLGDAETLASYWRHITESLARELDARDRVAIVAAAGTLDATPTTAMQAVVRGTIAVSAVATPSYALIAPDLAEAMAETPASDAPIGVPFQLPPILLGPGLAVGTVIVGARQAVRQLTFEPPVRAEAVNIPNGGIDAGLFSYSAELIENAAAVAGYTVTPVVPPVARGTAKASR